MKQPVSDLFPETLIVTLVNGIPMTDSVLTATYFDKKHLHVLRDIRLLIARLTESKFGFSESTDIAFNESKFGSVESTETAFNGRKFAPAESVTERKFPPSEVATERKSAPSEAAELAQAAAGFEACTYVDEKGETRPMYRMTHSAYSLLANRFTGSKALIWQVRFNNAFHDMDRRLNAQRDSYVDALGLLCPPLRPTDIPAPGIRFARSPDQAHACKACQL